MGERKVINHYFPPDFDPAKLPRRRRGKNPQVKVNMMIDMKLKCNVCGEYMNPGTKFNSRKETVQGDDYLGIKVFRFYIRCKHCYAELTFRTDPKNACYIAENNCTKIDMPWHMHARVVEQRDEELANADAIQILEHKTISGKKEMEDLDMLQELRDMQAQNSKIPTEKLLEMIHLKRRAAAEASGAVLGRAPELYELPLDEQLAADSNAASSIITEEPEGEEEPEVDESMFVKRIEDEEEEQKRVQELASTVVPLAASASVASVNNENVASAPSSILVTANGGNNSSNGTVSEAEAAAKKRQRNNVEFEVAKKPKKKQKKQKKQSALTSLGGYADSD